MPQIQNNSDFQDFLASKILQRKAENGFRTLTLNDGKIDFYSNDYLGLAQNEELIHNVKINYELQELKHKLGSTGSRLISGHHAYFEEVEEYLAQIFNTESALIFNSGYNANLALLSTIPQKGDTILYDELSHASLKDGMRLSFADRFSFKHNDLNDLETKIVKAKGRIYVVTESVYSMDGDSAPLLELSKLCEKNNIQLIVDEAHSTGVFGENGSGLVAELRIKNPNIIRIHTFGKAIGSHGACIVGSRNLKDYLINFARPFIYTTAMPLHNLVCIHEAFKYLKNNSLFQEKLKLNIQYFKEKFPPNFLKINSNSAIQIVSADGIEKIKAISQRIIENGMMAKPILSPTVKKGSERIRICLHSFNTQAEIDKLVHVIL